MKSAFDKIAAGLEEVAAFQRGEVATYQVPHPNPDVKVLRLRPNDTETLLHDLDLSIAQLRHAYNHLIEGRATNQEAFGRGLIAPEIRRLELIRNKLAAPSPSAT